jgi:hypothetical protein
MRYESPGGKSLFWTNPLLTMTNVRLPWEQVSVAARTREIDRADQRNCYQEYEGSQ